MPPCRALPRSPTSHWWTPRCRTTQTSWPPVRRLMTTTAPPSCRACSSAQVGCPQLAMPAPGRPAGTTCSHVNGQGSLSCGGLSRMVADKLLGPAPQCAAQADPQTPNQMQTAVIQVRPLVSSLACTAAELGSFLIRWMARSIRFATPLLTPSDLCRRRAAVCPSW